jgi:hypothetical protein
MNGAILNNTDLLEVCLLSSFLHSYSRYGRCELGYKHIYLHSNSLVHLKLARFVQ